MDDAWSMDYGEQDMKLVSTGPETLDSYYTMNTSSAGKSKVVVCLPKQTWMEHPIFQKETGFRVEILVQPAIKEIDMTRITLREQQKFSDPQTYLGIQMLVERYRHLFRDPEFGNFSLILSDGTTLRCDKKILSLSSDYFQAMLKHNTRETAQNEAPIQKFSTEAVTEFLIYAHTGECLNLGNHAEEVLEMTDMYQIKSLKDKAELALIKRISKTNCMKMLALSFTYGCRRLAAPSYIMYTAFAYELSKTDEIYYDFNCKYIQELAILHFFWFVPNFGNVPLRSPSVQKKIKSH
ncbi:hypothetical protein RvY_12950 [Ramazzottius varieornatus]|uniref:BTB domain-containing protein n=1 Tax=Ramazzottius varieornatus TaxID=947166 RepID=A0A1D1VTS4_RAMVA|nr:hypothetical protein RvY_12950 [Ramazzottius varieornatus]